MTRILADRRHWMRDRRSTPWTRFSAPTPINKIKDVVAEYAACGLDLLVLMPEVRSLRQLELLSEHVLPEYRH